MNRIVCPKFRQTIPLLMPPLIVFWGVSRLTTMARIQMI